MNVEKSRGGKFFEFLHCPFEGRANMHHKLQPNWQTGRCCLAGGLKRTICRKSKFFLSLLLPMQVDQHIFFPETCFAPTISEPEFTVWLWSSDVRNMVMSHHFSTYSPLQLEPTFWGFPYKIHTYY